MKEYCICNRMACDGEDCKVKASLQELMDKRAKELEENKEDEKSEPMGIASARSF